MADFYRFNTADEDKKIAASLVSENLYVLQTVSGALEVRFEQVTSEVAYCGDAVPGSSESDAVWRIKRLDITATGNVSTLYADGVAEFNKTWADRASYTY